MQLRNLNLITSSNLFTSFDIRLTICPTVVLLSADLLNRNVFRYINVTADTLKRIPMRCSWTCELENDGWSVTGLINYLTMNGWWIIMKHITHKQTPPAAKQACKWLMDFWSVKYLTIYPTSMGWTTSIPHSYKISSNLNMIW